MKSHNPIDFPTQIAPYLPKAFQDGRKPHLFVLTWLFVLILTGELIFTSEEKLAFPILSIIVLTVVEYFLFQWGASEEKVITSLLVVATLIFVYLSLMTGGIHSPNLNWIALAPLAAFYILGKRHGLIWLGIGFLQYCVVAWASANGLLLDEGRMGLAQLQGSFVTYTATLLTILLIPYLYNTLVRKTFKTRVVYNRQLKENQEALERLSAARELFLATVSHELRTPMNAILGFNNLLMQQAQDKPQALKILQHTQQSAEHLLTVINDVLDFSQLQAGKINVHPETFLLQDTVESAVSLFQQRLKSSQIDFSCVVEPAVAQWVRTDRHRLMQVLVNLLGNAIKFTHQGYVHVRVSNQNDGVLFSIKDTGIGITAEQQPHIFERFSQGIEIQARFGGNGLGLSISKQLVELMGGNIGFESVVGQGSHFWFYLPLQAQSPEIKPNVSRAGIDDQSENPYHFLLVDDHPINRLLARQILQSRWKNCVVVEADNGAKALDALKTQNFDLVLMDMVMPEMDGIEATQRLRQELQGEAALVPVMGLTANVNPNDLERFVKAGVDDTVLKPFEQDKLCAQVQHLLNKKKSSQGS